MVTRMQWHPGAAQHIIATLRHRNNVPVREERRPFKEIS